MRTVAKFQLECPAAGPSSRDVIDVVKHWGEQKFKWADDGSITINRSGAPAIFEQTSDQVKDSYLTSFKILEPMNGGELFTQIRILENS